MRPAAIREEVGFFQAIRAALVKSVPGDGKKSAADRELAIQQIVSRAVVSTEIVDIMKAAGLESPDISILSDEFLAEVRETDKKNLAIEALKKLINGDVRSQSKRNVTQSKAFSERLEAAIARYHANAITTAQVIEELIQLAKDIRAARSRGEETGLTRRRNRLLRRAGRERERAAGDGRAGAAGDRARAGRRASRATSRWTGCTARRPAPACGVLVKRLLRKYGYPPDLQDAAVQNVLQQAEALSAELAA